METSIPVPTPGGDGATGDLFVGIGRCGGERAQAPTPEDTAGPNPAPLGAMPVVFPSATPGGSRPAVKLSKQQGRLLNALREAWPAWVPNTALNAIAFAYSQRLGELRRKGWTTDTRCADSEHGLWEYRLVREPDASITAPIKMALPIALRAPEPR